ncbi:hypothetical protein BPAE_0294g00050 [Botrytis paeoniae]|uniref:Rhodopsin domain-containing protein n=1 Tax=Botrytis paeoniae TaxID=278948 RepID=A0A4Z1FAX5_9HELO|nr:hypothetical protein BPAE_0294g00050 [Botrytis paeoniae]
MITSQLPSHESRAHGIITCAAVMISVSTLAVILRFWSRAVTASLVFWWDDWAVLFTLATSHMFLATNIYWTTIGLGKHATDIPLTDIRPNAIANRVALVLYATVILMIKISALLLYTRLFKINRKFTITLWVVATIATVWWVITSIIPWSFCHPIKKDINPFIPGVCDENISWFMASAFINATMDLVILILPMPVIWRLQASLRKKLIISLVLLLGYCSAFLSFARFIMIVRNPDRLSASPGADPSWNLVPLLYLSILEGPFAIMALCGPSIGQLLSRVVEYRSWSSLFTTRPLQTTELSGSGISSSKRVRKESCSGFSKIGSLTGGGARGETTSTTAIAVHPNKVGDDWPEEEFSMGVIKVSRDVNISNV